MGKYIKYTIKTLEPVRIADDSLSHNGQAETLRYIPGSTIRGVVINNLAKRPDFETYKNRLFSDEVHFQNAYLTTSDGRILFPSPKGFYEDKKDIDDKEGIKEKDIQNVTINGVVDPGMKRASLGRYSYFKDNAIFYTSPEVSSDMKIRRNLKADETRTVIRNEFIKPGYTFTGYIHLKDDDLENIISNSLQKEICIGNARSQGYGKCKIDTEIATEMPYQEISLSEDATGDLYMMLLSNTVMTDDAGEPVGLNCGELSYLFGLSAEENPMDYDLKVSFASSSVTTVKGYNRIWKTKLPEVNMYEMGSIFHFCFSGVIPVDKLKSISEEGIGIRKNEGFGQVVFLKNYESIKKKHPLNTKPEKIIDNEAKKEDDEVIKVIAHNYLNNIIIKSIHEQASKDSFKKGNISNSQIGNIEAIILQYFYEPIEAKNKIYELLKRSSGKEDKLRVQKEISSVKTIKKHIDTIFDNSIFANVGLSDESKKIMGIPISELLSEDDINQMKLRLLLEEIRFDNKENTDAR